jgi:RNA polymerase sigma-70 factor (ECF subfamily)
MGEDRIVRLVKAAKNGDTTAFEELVALFEQRVYRLCLHLTGNHNDAEDLAQETFLKAYAGLAGFREEAGFGTWLHRITVNLWTSELRRRKRGQPSSLDAPLETDEGEELDRLVADPLPGPEEVLDEKETRRLLVQALNSLSPEHRAILVLREIQGCQYEEIARILACPVNTVKSRLNRARSALRRSMIGMVARHQALPDKKRKEVRVPCRASE